MLKKYVSNLFKTYKKGDATEPSYYKHLADFISEFSETQRKKKVDVTILPKKTEAGNPDFSIWDGRQKIIGYIEAKDLGADLDRIEDSGQLKRYLSTFPNVILTNYTEFRLYRNGQIISKVSAARPFIIKKLSAAPPVENEDELYELLQRFLDFSLPKTFTAKTLAVELAKRTKFLKDEIVTEELKSGTKSIHGFYEAFKEFLIAGISEEEFADLYSQTITYGLFAARLRAPEDFNRKLAYSFIPKSIGILRDIFKFISLEDLPQQMEVIIDDISEVLAVSDAKKILDQYYHEGKGIDPVLHFYETFLSVYDPATREKRGVYYTPEPVVSFIVHSLHEILKDKYDIADGLASKSITLLDPAGGTLGFLAKAIETAVKEFEGKYGKGAVEGFLKDQILQNYYSFELMMAPYAIGHMKMSFLLEELGYTMSDDERVKYYLTNTLEMQELDESKFPGMSSLSHESHEAGKIKNQVPILVILGNPPYSGHSSNTGEWISDVIKEYYQVDGKPLGEKNSKWLQDDYVKFIRFAQWKIDQAGEGVLGFITNHSYLDNPTFRGMRKSLMNSFDEIYILDLHGNSLKKEKAKDGSKDENVFDIQQGVAIAFFIKHKIEKTKSVLHSELFGLRDAKYDWLNKHNIKNVKWDKLEPNKEFYLFIPQDQKLQESYQTFMKITDIFPVNSVGIVTARDALTIGRTENEIWDRVSNFARLEPELARATYKLGVDTRDWKVELAQKDLIDSGLLKNNLKRILYRPFDTRYTYYTGNSRGFHCMPRGDTMYHMLEENVGMLFSRQLDKAGFLPVFISDSLIDAHSITSAVSITSILPLYLHPERKGKRKNAFVQMMMFEDEVEYKTRQPNIKKELFDKLKSNFKKKVKPEEIFYYVYAVLYSNIYRSKYAEFLKMDFPRVPFTADYILFKTLGKLGKQLADIHLLKSKVLDKTLGQYPMHGNHKVVKPYYEDEKVWINKTQYFNNVKEEVWNYQIGGYQVCDKWLKDRKGKTLKLEEIINYCKILTALSKTIEIQTEIDKL
ncbi:MAG: N-6 DNA methylase, partial [Ignavibacteriaceae bacterium]|nr:N-6 DNA methylase [Ignavibacteriaceae bacterium]